MLQEAGQDLHERDVKDPTCMKRFGGVMASASAVDAKRRLDDGTEPKWLIHPAVYSGQQTPKGLTCLAHWCPISAKNQAAARSDHVVVVQNNRQDKPCTQMMKVLNSVRSGDHVFVLTKAISLQEFNELPKEPANVDMIEIFDDDDDQAANVDMIEIFDDDDD